MPVEIKELVIKATVTSQTQTSDGVSAKDALDKQEIVDLCVAEVLKILKREKER